MLHLPESVTGRHHCGLTAPPVGGKPGIPLLCCQQYCFELSCLGCTWHTVLSPKTTHCNAKSLQRRERFLEVHCELLLANTTKLHMCTYMSNNYLFNTHTHIIHIQQYPIPVKGCFRQNQQAESSSPTL